MKREREREIRWSKRGCASSNIDIDKKMSKSSNLEKLGKRNETEQTIIEIENKTKKYIIYIREPKILTENYS